MNTTSTASPSRRKSLKHTASTKKPPDFYCLAAGSDSLIGGMLVYYFLNCIAQNQPAVYVKEVYVAENFRSQKISEKLMRALYAEAKAKPNRQSSHATMPDKDSTST
ncbi:GNAT family N-acetyltransferase [Neisseria iguanae]|uniref:GNAT family N-acetyltransferase n=1 Tax=Neisseria iguanae TaxID=90242 RepID=UPI001B8077F7|nr:GNAT family N-acetyltransferase [Neisseria iguanae]